MFIFCFYHQIVRQIKNGGLVFRFQKAFDGSKYQLSEQVVLDLLQ